QIIVTPKVAAAGIGRDQSVSDHGRHDSLVLEQSGRRIGLRLCSQLGVPLVPLLAYLPLRRRQRAPGPVAIRSRVVPLIWSLLPDAVGLRSLRLSSRARRKRN